LDLGRARARHDDAADHARRRDHRHVGPQSFSRPLVDRHRPEVGAGASGNHRSASRRERDRRPEIEQLLQHSRLLRERALPLEAHLQASHLEAQPLVLHAHLLQGDVVVPEILRLPNQRRGASLHFGEQAEGDRLEHRDAAARIHLRGDQDDVPDDHCQKQVAGALADIEDGHGREVTRSR
jgi:hypothetical protein